MAQRNHHAPAEKSKKKIIITDLSEDEEISQKITGKTDKNAEIAENCPICYEPITDKDSCSTNCLHRFHTSCLIQSAIIKPLCPMCREPLVKNAEAAPAPNDVLLHEPDLPIHLQSGTASLIFYNAGYGMVQSRWADIAINIPQQAPPQRHCGICGQTGHNRRNCPRSICQLCLGNGHNEHSCPIRF